MAHPFHRSGLASLSDLASEEWKDTFAGLELVQAEFLSRESAFRSEEYRKKWPTDALHSWSRLWEYPYVYHNLSDLYETKLIGNQAAVVDVGSGVTFFPFAVARLGFNVTCVDSDPVCGRDLLKVIDVVPSSPGSVSFSLSEGGRLQLADQSVDAVYCISVLEHVLEPERLVRECARIIKPGGFFFVTMDLDLKGNAEVGPDAHDRILHSLESEFKILLPERSIHPIRLLTTDNSPCPFPQLSPLETVWYRFQEKKLKPLLGKKSLPVLGRIHLAVQAFALVKFK